MNSISITSAFFLGLAIVGCSSTESHEVRHSVSRSDAPMSAASSPIAIEAFLYRAYPKEVLIQYDDTEAHARAIALKEAKGLKFWDEGVLEQYKADMTMEMDRILKPQLGNGIEIIRASPVVPQVKLRVISKEGLEWLRSNPKVTHVWLDANPSYVPFDDNQTVR